MQSGTKNPPWARSNVNSTNITGMNPQIMDPNAMAMSQQGIMPFQQSQSVFNANMMQAQSGMTMPLAGQMPMNQMAQGQIYPGNVVAYPTPRAMNPGMYQNAQSSQPQPSTNEQRVFTGTVTKTHNDFGFVDQDVFYQTSVCAKGIIPKVNERVLVEAVYNPNMPFKWNATRVQVLPKSSMSQNKPGPKSNTYNAVPPPQGGKKPMMNRRDERPPRRDDRPQHSHRKMYPVDKKQQDTPESFQKRSRTRSRSRSPRRESRRRDSPPRKRPATHQASPVKYVVRVPRMPLEINTLDVPTVLQRYTNLYIPSDFFSASVMWGETFPPQNSFPLNNPCSYHIMSKEVENPVPNDAVLEPPDADYRYSAKVMLISLPPLEVLYQRCGLMKGEDKRGAKSPLHPTRLIKFLVGQKGKGGEHFAVGGPWSPSLDGPDPTDPRTLVRTAVRSCLALTGVDLSAVTEWYRVVEFNYWRARSGGVERVALMVPGRAPATPWGAVTQRYARAAAAAARARDPLHAIEEPLVEDGPITIDEVDEVVEVKAEPTHHSKLDLKTIKVEQLKTELAARNANIKGLRHTLVARLRKLLKAEENKEKNGEEVMELDGEEQEQENDESKEGDAAEDPDKTVVEEVKVVEETKVQEEENKSVTADKTEEANDKPAEKPREKTEKEIEEEKKKLEKDIAQIKARYELPSTPHIIVHPSATAKGGKFNCTVASLSLLLDYRVSDNKEHSFELFVFAELFNEMLMRDFGFYIYKTLYTLPERVEEKEDKEKKEEKAEKEKDKKEDNKDKEVVKKDDKRDDKRESRKRDRKDSHSDDERSSSPSTKSCGVELPADPYLLLSLVYFDTGRGGQIGKKDLQNLFMSLGLKLSRAQVRTVLDKVCVKEYFNYKSLMQSIKEISTEVSPDVPIDTPITEPEVSAQISELEAMIAAGNRELLKPKKTDSEDGSSKEPIDVSDTGLVVYKSRVLEVGALVSALARSQAQSSRLEGALSEARAVARTMRSAAASTQLATKHAQAQLVDLSAQLAAAKNRVVSLTASSKIFHSALKSIQSKVEAVVNIKYEDDDVVEVVNGPSKVEKKEPKTEGKSIKDETVKKEERLKGKEAEVKKEGTEDKINKSDTQDNNEDSQDKNTDSQDKNTDSQDQKDEDNSKVKSTDMDVDKE